LGGGEEGEEEQKTETTSDQDVKVVVQGQIIWAQKTFMNGFFFCITFQIHVDGFWSLEPWTNRELCLDHSFGAQDYLISSVSCVRCVFITFSAKWE
jgi:hypothetical protein